jgi:hypothetical protein
MPQNSPIHEIARICQDRPSIPATELSIVEYLPGPRPQDADSEVGSGRARDIVQTLGSGALKIITLEYYNEGKGVLTADDTAPIVGSLAVLIEANRRHDFRNASWRTQNTNLQLLFHAGDTVTATSSGTTPFDKIMEAETLDTWAEFGVRLDYHADNEVTHFGHILSLGYLDTIAARLSQEA